MKNVGAGEAVSVKMFATEAMLLYAEKRRTDDTSKQEHTTGFEDPRMAQIPGFSYTNTLSAPKHG